MSKPPPLSARSLPGRVQLLGSKWKQSRSIGIETPAPHSRSRINGNRDCDSASGLGVGPKPRVAGDGRNQVGIMTQAEDQYIPNGKPGCSTTGTLALKADSNDDRTSYASPLKKLSQPGHRVDSTVIVPRGERNSASELKEAMAAAVPVFIAGLSIPKRSIAPGDAYSSIPFNSPTAHPRIQRLRAQNAVRQAAQFHTANGNCTQATVEAQGASSTIPSHGLWESGWHAGSAKPVDIWADAHREDSRAENGHQVRWAARSHWTDGRESLMRDHRSHQEGGHGRFTSSPIPPDPPLNNHHHSLGVLTAQLPSESLGKGLVLKKTQRDAGAFEGGSKQPDQSPANTRLRNKQYTALPVQSHGLTSTGSSSGAEYSGPYEQAGATDSSGSILLTLRSGAFGIPKRRLDPSARSSQLGSAESSPRYDPLSKGTKSVQVGEDAYFIRRDAMGVSDGVGGWTSKNRKRPTTTHSPAPGDPDPSRFSRLLMHFCEAEVDAWSVERSSGVIPGNVEKCGHRASSNSVEPALAKMVESHKGKPPTEGLASLLTEQETPAGIAGLRKGKPAVLDPVEVMQKGYEKCIECIHDEGIFGSATCLLAVLDGEDLRIANLGDCAIVLVRNGEIVFRTEEMQHSFNFPVQLGTNSKDEPMKDAQLSNVKVQKGDIVVMCSDGLVDNLFDEDILDVIARYTPASGEETPLSQAALSSSPQAISKALCEAASEASEDLGGASPFMCKAIEEGFDFLGGKKDDISVLVAVVEGANP